MNNVTTNTQNTIDIRDIINRIEELRDDGSDADELATLEELMSDLRGYGGDEQWEGEWYPLTLIHDRYFTEAMRELCSDIGAVPDEAPNWLAIDWEATARNLRIDYTSVEFDGTTYWSR